MKLFIINKKDGSKFNLNLPTSIKEIKNEYLEDVTSHIHIAPYYSLIAIVYREKLGIILNTTKNKQNITTSCVPLFIKTNAPIDADYDNSFVKGLKTGDALVISGSDLSIGYHVASPTNDLSIAKVCNICSEDTNIYRDSLTIPDLFCFVEFKIVPNNAIKGLLGTNYKTNNLYVNTINC